MTAKSSNTKKPAEQVVRDIRRATRRHFSAEDKIRILLDGLRSEVDCPRFGRHFPASRRGGFERLGIDAANMAVAAGSVVEDLDIVEDVGTGEVPCFVDALLNALLLQARDE